MPPISLCPPLELVIHAATNVISPHLLLISPLCDGIPPSPISSPKVGYMIVAVPGAIVVGPERDRIMEFLDVVPEKPIS
jgi:hypothetical protein